MPNAVDPTNEGRARLHANPLGLGAVTVFTRAADSE
jgi:hypothetical protein